jgi:hypothetical protein
VIGPAPLLLLACLAAPLQLDERLRVELDLGALDLAFLDHERLAVLSEDALTVYRLVGTQLEREARLPLPGEPLPARAGAGLLRVVPGEAACWAASNRRSGATLFRLEGGRLFAVAGAEAIPPSALPAGAPAEGARLRPSTNLLQAGSLRLLRLGERLAVASDGALLVDGEPEAGGRRSGDALAGLGSGLWIGSGDAPPSDVDELRILRLEGDRVVELAAFPVQGRIRALASRPGPAGPIVAVAADTLRGAQLAIFELAGRP